MWSALDTERDLPSALWLPLPCQGQGLLLSYSSKGSLICFLGFLAVFLICGKKVGEIEAFLLGRKTLSIPLLELFHLWVCSIVSPFIHCASYQITLLLAVLSCQQLTLVSLRCCFHQGTRVDPLKLGPRIVIMDLDVLWGQL